MAKLTKGDYVSRVLWSCSIMLGCPQEHSGSIRERSWSAPGAKGDPWCVAQCAIFRVRIAQGALREQSRKPL